MPLFYALTTICSARRVAGRVADHGAFDRRIEREHRVQPKLTAIVDKNFDPDQAGARFAFNLLRRSNILVATTADLPELAELARKELKL